MITLDEFENFIHTDLVYEQKIISVIDDQSRQILIENIGELYKYPNCTVKLEQMEKYNRSIFQECRHLSTKYFHFGPVTCHAFLAFKNSKSFGLHTDPDDVIIQCISGSKTIYINEQKRILKSGDSVYIPADTPHEIINEDKSLILSFGMEKFYVDKVNYGLNVLSEND